MFILWGQERQVARCISSKHTHREPHANVVSLFLARKAWGKSCLLTVTSICDTRVSPRSISGSSTTRFLCLSSCKRTSLMVQTNIFPRASSAAQTRQLQPTRVPVIEGGPPPPTDGHRETVAHLPSRSQSTCGRGLNASQRNGLMFSLCIPTVRYTRSPGSLDGGQSPRGGWQAVGKKPGKLLKHGCPPARNIILLPLV